MTARSSGHLMEFVNTRSPNRPGTPSVADQIATLDVQLTMLRVNFRLQGGATEDATHSKEIAWEIRCLEAARETILRSPQNNDRTRSHEDGR